MNEIRIASIVFAAYLVSSALSGFIHTILVLERLSG
jgi:hypothetical protein